MADYKKPKSKIGILKYIASSGAKGVKFEDEPETWYNPATDECKEQVKTEYKGKQVEIMLTGKKHDFSSMVLLESTPEEQPAVEEETIEEETVEEQPDQPKGEEVANEEEKSQIETEEEIADIARSGQIIGLLSKIRKDIEQRQYTKKVYSDMEQTKLETAQKGPHKLTYASWAEAWGALKRAHPTAQFEVHENKNGLPYFMGDEPAMGAFVKVSVTVLGLTHTVHLPVMDHMNKSITKDKMTTFDVNKNIQRALAKAISLHGLGLYVFRGEDYPDEFKVRIIDTT